MNAIQPMMYDRFPSMARALCDERGWDTVEQFEKVQHHLRWSAYQEAIRPFIKLRCDLMRFKIPKMTIHSDGQMETVYEWTEEEKKQQAQLDELIAYEAQRVGLPVNGSATAEK